jgi:hypothetical protein
MVLDDKHYRTDQFYLKPGQVWTNYGYYNQKNYVVPELSEAVSIEGKPIYCKTEVRVGILTRTEKKEKTISGIKTRVWR